jgi:hypothetical protein
MLLLTATTDFLELNTQYAYSTDWVTSYIDHTTTAFTPGSAQGNVATAAAITMAGSPADSTQRQLKRITVRNRDATNTQTVYIDKNSGGTPYRVTGDITLAPGEVLSYVDGIGFAVAAANGATKMSGVSGSSGSASGVTFPVIVSATLAASQDNYAPTGWSALTTYLKLSAAVGGSVLSSLANVATANLSAIELCNPSLTDAITFPHLTGSGVQFSCPNAVASVLGPNANTFLLLDSGVWRFS